MFYFSKIKNFQKNKTEKKQAKPENKQNKIAHQKNKKTNDKKEKSTKMRKMFSFFSQNPHNSPKIRARSQDRSTKKKRNFLNFFTKKNIFFLKKSCR